MPFVDVPGARLYWEVQGSGPPLLMIPGYGCTVEIYDSNRPALSERFTTIIFDPRGAGRSDVPASGYSMQAYADDCVALIEAAGFESAHVFGCSFGGMVAQNLALLHPARVRRMVLGCTTPGGVRHVMPPRESMLTFMAASGIEDPIAAVRSTYPLHYSDTYAKERDAEITARAQRNAHLRGTKQGLEGQVAAVATHDTWDRLPSIETPTMVAHGDDDGVVPVDNGRNIAERIPGARLRLYEGARHIFFVERASELNTDIIAFLSENER